jgi:hypothetical protein
VLKSLGAIALLGTLAIWWVGLIVLPGFLEHFVKLEKRPEEGSPNKDEDGDETDLEPPVVSETRMHAGAEKSGRGK